MDLHRAPVFDPRRGPVDKQFSRLDVDRPLIPQQGGGFVDQSVDAAGIEHRVEAGRQGELPFEGSALPLERSGPAQEPGRAPRPAVGEGRGARR